MAKYTLPKNHKQDKPEACSNGIIIHTHDTWGNHTALYKQFNDYCGRFKGMAVIPTYSYWYDYIRPHLSSKSDTLDALFKGDSKPIPTKKGTIMTDNNLIKFNGTDEIKYIVNTRKLTEDEIAKKLEWEYDCASAAKIKEFLANPVDRRVEIVGHTRCCSASSMHGDYYMEDGKPTRHSGRNFCGHCGAPMVTTEVTALAQ